MKYLYLLVGMLIVGFSVWLILQPTLVGGSILNNLSDQKLLSLIICIIGGNLITAFKIADLEERTRLL